MATPRVTIPELPPVAALDDADLIVVQNGETTKRMPVGSITIPGRTAIADHLSDVSDAHQASAIGASPNPVPLDGTNVQLQLGQAAAEIIAIKPTVAGLAAHLADTDDAHDASAISVTPLQYRTGTNVQALLAELSTIVGDGEMIEVGATAPPDTEWLWADTTEGGTAGDIGGGGTAADTTLFSVRSYGATDGGGDTAKDQAAFSAALAAAALKGNGGIVVIDVDSLNLGTARYTVPNKVGLIGRGKAAPINFATGGGLDIGVYGTESRHPIIADIYVSGTNQSTNPLTIGQVVNSRFRNVATAGATDTALTIKGAQNCTFEGFDIVGGTGCKHGVVVDSFVFNCTFVHPIIVNASVSSFRVTDTMGVANQTPHWNNVYGGIIENAFNSILMDAGTDFGFYGTNLSGSGPVRLYKSGPGTLNRVIFDRCEFQCGASTPCLQIGGGAQSSVPQVTVSNSWLRTGSHVVEAIDSNFRLLWQNNNVAETMPLFTTSAGVAANAVIIAEDLKPVIDPRTLGATGDGATNDTAALQAALDVAKTVKGTVVIPPGTYNHTGLLVDQATGVTVRGEGGTLYETTGNSIHLSFTTCTNIRVLNLNVAGAPGPRTSGKIGINVRACTDVLIEGCTVSDPRGGGIFIGGTGPPVVGSSYVRVIGNKINRSMADGIHTTHTSHHITIVGNETDSTGDDCIAVVSYVADGGKCTDVTITGNVVRNGAGRGITCLGGDRIVVSANVIDTMYTSGMIFGYDGAYGTYGCESLTVANNTMRNVALAGSTNSITVNCTDVYRCDNVLIQGNTILDGRYRGICLIGTNNGMRGVAILDNIIVRGANNAVRVAVGQGVSVRRNTIVDCEGIQIAVLPATNTVDAIVAENVCLNPNPSAAANIRFVSAEADTPRLTIFGNIVNGGTLQSMYRVPSTTNCVIYGNLRDGVVADTFNGTEPVAANRGSQSMWANYAFKGNVGFYGVTPIARPTVPVAAVDPATTMALVNAVRTALVNLGLVV